MSWIVVGVTVVSTAITMYSQNEAGKAAKATSKYNAKLAENEAKAKEQQAHVESQQMQKQKERLLASQRAGFAKGGASITEGTPLLLMAEQAGEAELDILQHQRNRAMEVTALRSEAEMHRYEGKQARKASKLAMASTAIGAIGSIAGAKGGGGKAPKTKNAGMTMKSEAPASVRKKYGWNE